MITFGGPVSSTASPVHCASPRSTTRRLVRASPRKSPCPAHLLRNPRWSVTRQAEQRGKTVDSRRINAGPLGGDRPSGAPPAVLLLLVPAHVAALTLREPRRSGGPVDAREGHSFSKRSAPRHTRRPSGADFVPSAMPIPVIGAPRSSLTSASGARLHAVGPSGASGRVGILMRANRGVEFGTVHSWAL